MKKSFTLTEILIVIGIIFILVSVLIFILKPLEIFTEARDNQRISDIKNIEKAITLININNPHFSELDYASSNTIYLSLPDTSSTCGSWLSQLPSLPPPWKYHCSSNPTNVDGTGWIPILFSNNAFLNLSKLPIDPINNGLYYYTFVVGAGYELTVLLERSNKKGVNSISDNDGGTSPYIYEVGSNKNLTLNEIENRGSSLLSFIKRIDINENREEWGYSVISEAGGSYLISGFANTFGASDEDIFILKFDSSNNFLWQKKIDTDFADRIWSMTTLGNENYILVGTRSWGGFFVLKVDSSGNLLWSKEIRSGNNPGAAYAVLPTSDNGYIVVGYTGSGSGPKGFIVKFDSNDNFVWARSAGWSSSNDYFRSVIQLSNGDYIFLGYADPFWIYDYSQIFLLRLSSSGSFISAKKIGGNLEEFGRSLINTSDGGYLAIGETNSFGSGSYDILVLKFDSTDNLAWAKAIGGSNFDKAYSAIQTLDGGYLIIGSSLSFSNKMRVLILKLNSSGNLSWAKTVNVFLGNDSGSEGYSITQSSDGGYLIVGTSFDDNLGTDAFILKLDSSGNIRNCNDVENVYPTVVSLSTTTQLLSPTISSISPTINTISSNTSSLASNIYLQCQ